MDEHSDAHEFNTTPFCPVGRVTGVGTNAALPRSLESLPVVAVQTTGSEGIAERELESPRPPGAEEAARRAQCLVEARRGDVIVKSGIVIVVEAPNICDVGEVEDLADALEFLFVEQREGLSYAHVQRIEIASELQVGIYVRQG
jgi:hypothetical protein